MTFTIGLHSLRLPVRIGWGEAERATPQTIRFDVEITLAEPPLATETDQLPQTIDYQGVAEVIRQVATREPFRLLERLAQVVRDELHQVLPVDASLVLRVVKEKPPIPNLSGGASVTIRDAPRRS